MNILVVGCGSIGERHTRNLLALGAAVTVVEPRESRCAEIHEKYGVATYATTGEAYSKTKFQAVLITNPPHLHLSTAREAAEQGCDVFIEKPFSHTLEGVSSLTEFCRRRGLVTLVGCNLRFLKSLNKVREIVGNGKLGNIASARIQFGLYLPSWRPHQTYTENYGAHRSMGGGAILDVIHEFDYAYWLLGGVRDVFCFADKRSHLEIETEDIAAALLRFESGVIGEVHVDYVQRAYTRECEIIGDLGTVRWKFTGQTVSLYLSEKKEWAEFAYPQDVNEMYMDEMRHFLECIGNRQQTCCPFDEAERVLELAIAAKTSAETGKPVQLVQPVKISNTTSRP